MAASAAIGSGTVSQSGPDSQESPAFPGRGFGRSIQEMKETQPAPGGLRLLSFIGMGIGFAMAVLLRIVLIARQLPVDLPIEWACPVLSSTGLLCMGCGATRALRSLLEGNLATAMRQNLLFVTLLAALPLRRLLMPLTARLPLLRQPGRLAGWVLLAIALAFMIVRNLDGALPALLRP